MFRAENPFQHNSHPGKTAPGIKTESDRRVLGKLLCTVLPESPTRQLRSWKTVKSASVAVANVLPGKTTPTTKLTTFVSVLIPAVFRSSLLVSSESMGALV